jgi:serine/threonine-protein kinase
MATSETPQSPVPIGELVDGKYRVERVIGVGGMGCVVQATHLQLLTPVAIKFVIDPDVGDHDTSTRFLREARTASSLTSEHVARVIDVGTLPSGCPFMVMDYLEGETFEERLAKGTLSVDEIVQVLIQACDGLAEAHGRGIVHRDVKPANLFLVQRPMRSIFVKVLDFGISRVADPRLAVKEGLTGTSAIMGTPQFMAPEQMTSTKMADARADVWALGVTMYRALSGRYPFNAATLMELGALVLATEAVPLEHVVPGISPPLAAIVRQCLQRDPALRFASAAELQRALLSLPSLTAQPTPHATTDVAPALPMQTSATHALTMASPAGVSAGTSGRRSGSAGLVMGLLLTALVIGGMGTMVALRARAKVAVTPPEATTAVVPANGEPGNPPAAVATPPASASTTQTEAASAEPVVASAPSAPAAHAPGPRASAPRPATRLGTKGRLGAAAQGAATAAPDER